MKALKEDMSEEIANIPEELLKKAYSIDFSIIDGEVARLKVQGSYDSDVVKKYYQRAVISAGGYVEFRVGGIYCVMT